MYSISSSFCGSRLILPCPSCTAPRSVTPLRCSMAPTRRALLSVVGGGLLLNAAPSFGAYGEGANIFGKTTDTSGYIPYVGEGYALLLPSKWNPSKEKDFPNTVLRWEDNFDPLSHVVVMKTPTEKGSIEQVAPMDKFLNVSGSFIGEQVFKGETISEGGFEKDKVSAASLLEQDSAKDKNGRTYYRYQLLVRTADGNEGGRHVLLTATVAGGNMYVTKVQVGDKRWFKGANKQAMTIRDSFTVV